VEIRAGFEGADERVVDKHKDDGGERAALLNTTVNGYAGTGVEGGAGDGTVEKTTYSVDEPSRKTLGGEGFEDKVMMYGVKGLCVVCQQNEELLVGAPFGVEFGVEISEVFRHKAASDETLLRVVEQCIHGGGNENNKGEGDKSVVSVVDAEWSCIVD